MLYNRSFLVIHYKYTSVHMSIPNSLSLPPTLCPSNSNSNICRACRDSPSRLCTLGSDREAGALEGRPTLGKGAPPRADPSCPGASHSGEGREDCLVSTFPDAIRVPSLLAARVKILGKFQFRFKPRASWVIDKVSGAPVGFLLGILAYPLPWRKHHCLLCR